MFRYELRNIFTVLSDFARNDRQKARKALESGDARELGIHLFLWLMFPEHTSRKHWQREIKTFLTNILQDLTSVSHVDKTLGVAVPKKLYLDAKALMWELDSQTSSCQSRALTKMSPAKPTFIPEDQDTFSDFGFRIEQHRDSKSGEVYWLIFWKTEQIASTKIT